MGLSVESHGEKQEIEQLELDQGLEQERSAAGTPSLTSMLVLILSSGSVSMSLHPLGAEGLHLVLYLGLAQQVSCQKRLCATREGLDTIAAGAT